MEKVKKEKAVKRVRKHGSDFVLRIVSIIFAIIIWFAMSITQYPTINRTFTKVPVTFSLEGTQAKEKGLSVLNKEAVDDITVEVEISGMNYEIGGYTASDLIASVDTSNVSKEGTYDLNIEVRSAHTTDKVSIISVTPDTVSVSFDKITTKKIPVVSEAPLVTAMDGYTLRDTKVSPDSVTIEGPQNDIDKISKAVVSITDAAKLDEELSLSTEDYEFYDDDDNLVMADNVKLTDTKSFKVDFVVYKKKTMNLGVTVENAPSYFDKSTLPMILSEESVSVATPDLDAEAEQTVLIGSVDLTQIDLNNVYSFDIPLASGEVNMSGEDHVTVTFEAEGYTSKNFTLTSDHFVAVNKPSGKDIAYDTKKLSAVKVYGPEDIISKLTDDDLYAEIDLSGIKSNGSYTKTAMIYSPKCNSIWGYGSNDVQVEVSDVQPAEESDSSEE